MKRKNALNLALCILAALVLVGAITGIALRIAGDRRGEKMLQNQQAITPPDPKPEPDTALEPEPEPEPEPDMPDTPDVPDENPSPEPEPAPEPEPEPDETDALRARAEELLAELTLEEKLYQLLFVTPEALTGVGTVSAAGETTRQALEQYPVGGIIYFAQNLQAVSQTQDMLSNTQTYAKAAHGIGVFTGVDEEGGRVARCAMQLGTTAYEPMRTYGDAGDEDSVYEIGQTFAKDLLGLGFNVDFAPVSDVISNPDNNEIGDRSFGEDPELVAKMVAAQVRGMSEGGLCATLKHFPGLGSTSTDSHSGFDLSDRTLDELRECDLVPFAAGIEAGAPFVMVGHMTLSEVDELPCSLSEKVVTGILRDELGYDGIVITDALNMGAISNYYTSSTSAVLAISAGCDMLLCPRNIETVHAALLSAVQSGELTEARIDESVLRILMVKLQYGIAA